MSERQTNPYFMNGVPELLVLCLLQDRERYGYEIVQAIRERSEEAIETGEGVIYPVLHALEQGGALKARRKTVNGRSRIYYSLTRAGSRRFVNLSKDWSTLVTAIQSVLAGKKYAETI